MHSQKSEWLVARGDFMALQLGRVSEDHLVQKQLQRGGKPSPHKQRADTWRTAKQCKLNSKQVRPAYMHVQCGLGMHCFPRYLS